jgi:hypothetical protein
MNVWALLTIAVMTVASLVQPRRARCPDGMYVNGVRPSGAFECRIAPKLKHEAPPDSELGGRIYCTGGTRPIVVDYRTVGCQRGGWR